MHFVIVLGELDAAGLAATTGMDLRLHHPQVAGDGLGRGDGLVWRARDAPGRYCDAVVGKQLLRLIFVEVHASPRWGVCCWTRGGSARVAPCAAKRPGALIESADVERRSGAGGRGEAKGDRHCR